MAPKLWRQSYGAKGMHAFIDYHRSGICYHQMSSACGSEYMFWCVLLIRRMYIKPRSHFPGSRRRMSPGCDPGSSLAHLAQSVVIRVDPWPIRARARMY